MTDVTGATASGGRLMMRDTARTMGVPSTFGYSSRMSPGSRGAVLTAVAPPANETGGNAISPLTRESTKDVADAPRTDLGRARFDLLIRQST